jgi:hypothetical protein
MCGMHHHSGAPASDPRPASTQPVEAAVLPGIVSVGSASLRLPVQLPSAANPRGRRLRPTQAGRRPVRTAACALTVALPAESPRVQAGQPESQRTFRLRTGAIAVSVPFTSSSQPRFGLCVVRPILRSTRPNAPVKIIRRGAWAVSVNSSVPTPRSGGPARRQLRGQPPRWRAGRSSRRALS